MKLKFVVTVTEDDHSIKLSSKFFRQLGDDVASAVAANELVEGNAVSCDISEAVFGDAALREKP